MRKTIVYCLRKHAICRALRNGGMIYRMANPETINGYQLARLNACWHEAVENVPFYRYWKDAHRLPDDIVSFEDYAAWPILRKSDLQSHCELLKRKTDKPVHWSVTGGSTGEPLHFGTFLEQSETISSDILVARAAINFLPGDRVFLFWGHRHFYGHGFIAKFNFFIRRCKDWANNTYRADACDLSSRYLSFVGRKILHFKPEVIISYSASLLAFCRFMKSSPDQFQGLHIKCVLCTAGPLTKKEREEISTFFNAPVYMEYGAMDAGIMGYMMQEGVYAVLQHHCLLQTYNDGVGDLNLVTPLTENYLPLFRYQIGDYLSGCTYTSDGRVLTIGEVWGRGSDVIVLASGLRFQVQTFMVLAEEIDKILAYQLVKTGAGLEFHVQTSSPLTSQDQERLFEKAYSIIPDLRQEGFLIIEDRELIKAPSGKIKLLVDLTE